MGIESERAEREDFLRTLPPQVNWDPTKPEGYRVVADDSDRERVRSIADLDSLPLSDEARVEIDALGNGQGIIETYSSDNLEEDLANMELTGRYTLPEKVRNETVKSAVAKVLQELSPYIPQEKLNLLFPGLNLTSIEDYDLSNSRIRFHILPDDDYKALHQTLNGDKKIVWFRWIYTYRSKPSCLSAGRYNYRNQYGRKKTDRCSGRRSN